MINAQGSNWPWTAAILRKKKNERKSHNNSCTQCKRIVNINVKWNRVSTMCANRWTKNRFSFIYKRARTRSMQWKYVFVRLPNRSRVKTWQVTFYAVHKCTTPNCFIFFRFTFDYFVSIQCGLPWKLRQKWRNKQNISNNFFFFTRNPMCVCVKNNKKEIMAINELWFGSHNMRCTLRSTFLGRGTRISIIRFFWQTKQNDPTFLKIKQN